MLLRKNTRIKGGRLVVPGDQDRHLAAQFGIAGAHRIPHLAQFGLAAAVAHMRQDIDRRVGEEFDVVGAALQRGFDVAGIHDVEEIQHVLAI